MQIFLKWLRAPKTPEPGPRKDSQALLGFPSRERGCRSRFPKHSRAQVQHFPRPSCSSHSSDLKTPADEQVWLHPSSPRRQQEPCSPSGNDRTGWMQESSWERRSSSGASYWISSVAELRVPHRAHAGFTSQLQRARLPRWAWGTQGTRHGQPAQGQHKENTPKAAVCCSVPCTYIYTHINTCCICI